MDREQMEDAIYAKSKLDMDVIQSLTNSQLEEMLGIKKSQKPKQARRTVKRLPNFTMTKYEFVEHEGALHRVETWNNSGHESKVYVRCGNTVRFNGRTVSSSIVLYWLMTGELVSRVPKVKPQRIQAAIRFGGRTVHLGRFETREEVEAAKAAAKFRISLGLSPIG